MKSLLEICEKWWSETMETINFRFFKKKWKICEHNFFHFFQETGKTSICKFLWGDASPDDKNARVVCETFRYHVCRVIHSCARNFLARLHVLGDACFSLFKNVQKRDLPKNVQKCANFIIQESHKNDKNLSLLVFWTY